MEIGPMCFAIATTAKHISIACGCVDGGKGPEGEILVHVYDTHYETPKGFDYEWTDPKQPPPEPVTDGNVADQAEKVKLLRLFWNEEVIGMLGY